MGFSKTIRKKMKEKIKIRLKMKEELQNTLTSGFLVL